MVYCQSNDELFDAYENQRVSERFHNNKPGIRSVEDSRRWRPENDWTHSRRYRRKSGSDKEEDNETLERHQRRYPSRDEQRREGNRRLGDDYEDIRQNHLYANRQPIEVQREGYNRRFDRYSKREYNRDYDSDLDNGEEGEEEVNIRFFKNLDTDKPKLNVRKDSSPKAKIDTKDIEDFFSKAKDTYYQLKDGIIAIFKLVLNSVSSDANNDKTSAQLKSKPKEEETTEDHFF